MVTVLEKDDMDEFKALLKQKTFAVVDFTATWCGPCNIIGPKFKALADLEENKDILFVKVDVDDCAGVAEECEVEAMPTFHFYKDGNKVAHMMGADEAELKKNVAALNNGSDNLIDLTRNTIVEKKILYLNQFNESCY